MSGPGHGEREQLGNHHDDLQVTAGGGDSEQSLAERSDSDRRWRSTSHIQVKAVILGNTVLVFSLDLSQAPHLNPL